MNLLIVLSVLLSTCLMVHGKPQIRAENDEPAKVKIQVYYSPIKKGSIDFFTMNNVENKTHGIYEMLMPGKTEDAPAKFSIEVDLIPWGSATRKFETNKFVYTCESDAECKATRLHACITRHHRDLLQNHHEFYMCECIATQADWTTNPLGGIDHCQNLYPEVIAEMGLTECASQTSDQGNVYLNEAKTITDMLYPTFDNELDPYIIVNSEHKEDAHNNLRKAVCEAFSDDDRPKEECKLYNASATLYIHSALLVITGLIGLVYNSA